MSDVSSGVDARYTPGASSTENEGADSIGKLRGQAGVLYEEPHVDRTIKRVQKQIEVDVFAQLAALNPPSEQALAPASVIRSRSRYRPGLIAALA